MSPGYSSSGCAGPTTAFHAMSRRTSGTPREPTGSSDDFAAQRQHAAFSLDEQPLPHQLRADRDTALAAPVGDQRVDGADLLVGQADGPAGVQPGPDHSAPDRRGQR